MDKDIEKIKVGVVTTITRPDYWQYAWEEALDNFLAFADEVMVVKGDDAHDSKLIDEYRKKLTKEQSDKLKECYLHWPDEWHWNEIEKHLNYGFDRLSDDIDWGFRMDIDYMIHEDKFDKIRLHLHKCRDFPVTCGVKLTMLNKERGYKKCRIPMMVNMKAWHKVKFGRAKDEDKGRCIPVYRSDECRVNVVGDTGISIYNYDNFFKTKEKTKEHFFRFSKAYHKERGRWTWGKTPQEAFDVFHHQMAERLRLQPLKPREHPKHIIDRINKMPPEEMGYDNWGIYKPNGHTNNA